MFKPRKVLIIFSLDSGVDSLLWILNKFRNDSLYVLIHEDDSRVVYSELKRAYRDNVRILVLSSRDVEVKSLKILVDTEPDVIVDCDYSNKLVVFKNLLESSPLEIVRCMV